MTCQPYNIKVVENNSFALLMPLKKRTYVASVPIDEDIDATALEDVVLKIGDVQYTPELGTDGVRVVVADGLTRGTYNITMTAKYRGSDIQVAYFEAITAVQWNYQSDAEQYVQGSPITMEAAYVIGGVLTDAELAELKLQLHQAIEGYNAAKEAADAAKEEYDEKAEALDGVAQEQTSQQILSAVGGVAQQGDNPNATLSETQAQATSAASDAAAAKQAAQAITGYALQGSDATATNTALAALIGYTISEIDGV